MENLKKPGQDSSMYLSDNFSAVQLKWLIASLRARRIVS